MRPLATIAAGLFLAACQAPAPSASPSPPLVTPAVDAVIAAFADHQVVAIGEQHGSAAQHEFLRSVIRDPRLIGVIDDVAVEFGSARYQDTIDRYMRGEAISPAELELVWTDTTQRSGVWDDPIYRQFFEAVREQNIQRAQEDRIRVLLGDPPIMWDQITAETDCDDSEPTCLDFWIMGRSDHFASVVQNESIARGRRALVIAGSGHIRRNPDAEFPISLTDQLDALEPGAVWTLVPLPRSNPHVIGALVDVGGGDSTGPVVIELEGTQLGAVVAEGVFERGTVTCDPAPCESEAASTATLQSVTDAVLLL
ncbi:MAG TPA: ChaN family lipoprotein [Candidatus Limnocylindria bacterium]|nr:ChaN family lipoprotein [Candidatus Limnocylindria bacterium]